MSGKSRPALLVVVLLLAWLGSARAPSGSRLPPATLPHPSVIRQAVTISTSSGARTDGAAVAASYGIPVDWGLYTAYPYIRAAQRTVQQRIQATHMAGRLYVQYVSASLVYTGLANLGDLRPELLQYAAIDLDGKPIASPFLDLMSYKMNINEAGWREFLRSEVALAIDLGADGIALDDIQAQVPAVGWQPAGVFNKVDLEGFRAFLRTLYPAAVLRSRFQIEDVGALDYRRYLIDRGYGDLWRSAPWQVPLYQEFVTFEYQATLRHYAELIRWAKEYARSTQEKTIVFLGNTSNGLDISLPFEHSLDIAWLEFPYRLLDYAPRCKVIPASKVTIDGRAKKGAYLTQVSTSGDLARRGHPATIAKLFIAEAYASRAEFQVPIEMVGDGANYSPNLKELAPYYQFIDAHRVWFGPEWSWPARVGVLYSIPAFLAGSDSYYGAALALFDAGIQFDAVFSGDGRIVPNAATAATLGRYPVIVLSNPVAMTAEQVQMVLDYLRAGGTVVAWGSFGAANEFQDWSVERPREWRDLWSVGTHRVGAGTLVNRSPSDLGLDYLIRRSDDTRAEIIRAIAPLAPPEITLDGRDLRHVNALVYRHAAGDRLAVHLINYDYQVDNDSVREVGPIRVTIRLPDGFSVEGRQGHLLSPDVAEPQRVEYRVTDGRATFTVPRLYIYALITLDEAATPVAGAGRGGS